MILTNAIRNIAIALGMLVMPWTAAHSGFFDDIKGAFDGIVKKAVTGAVHDTKTEDENSQPPAQPSQRQSSQQEVPQSIPTSQIPSASAEMTQDIGSNNSGQIVLMPSSRDSIVDLTLLNPRDYMALLQLFFAVRPQYFSTDDMALNYAALRRPQQRREDCPRIAATGMNEFKRRQYLQPLRADLDAAITQARNTQLVKHVRLRIRSKFANYDFENHVYPISTELFLQHRIQADVGPWCTGTNNQMRLEVVKNQEYLQVKDKFGVPIPISGIALPIAPAAAEAYSKAHASREVLLEADLEIQQTGREMELRGDIVGLRALDPLNGSLVHAWSAVTPTNERKTVTSAMITPAIREEANRMRQECNRYAQHRAFYDCNCVANKFAEKRALDASRHFQSSYDEAKLECINRDGVASNEYDSCVREVQNRIVDYQGYCTCYSNKFADMFVDSGGAPNSKAMVMFGAQARQACGYGHPKWGRK